MMSVQFASLASLLAAFAMIGLDDASALDRVIQDPLGFRALGVAFSVGAVSSLNGLWVFELGAPYLFRAFLAVGFTPVLLP